MSRLMTMPHEGLTKLIELPAVVKKGEVIVPPRPEFLDEGEEGINKLRSLARSLGGELIFWKFRARLEELEYQACVEQDCYLTVETSTLYCEKHNRSSSRIGQVSTPQVDSQKVTQLRPAR